MAEMGNNLLLMRTAAEKNVPCGNPQLVVRDIQHVLCAKKTVIC